jgi:hypothetical protein
MRGHLSVIDAQFAPHKLRGIPRNERASTLESTRNFI